MTFDESKISAEKAAETGVQSQPDALTGSAEENKKVFDLLPLLIIERLNKLIESLQAANSAGQIGADAFTNVTGGTVQEQLQSIQKNLEDYRREVKENGAENVGMTPFDGVNANTVQAALEQLQANLVRYINAVKSADGAGRVGITPFKGVTSGTVQAALEEIRRQIDDVTAGVIPDYGVTTIKLALQAVTADRLAQDVLDMIEAAEPARSTNELDDYTMETGCFINAGAGWNTFKFRHPFEGVPVVTVTPKEFSGFCEIKNVSKEGFLYCVRKPQLQDGSVTEGTVTTATGYIGSDTGTSPGHSKVTYVSGVTLPVITLPTYGTVTTDEKIEMDYIAIEFGGDE